jgi:hypothetical protein
VEVNMSGEKIGMYTAEEILEFMTNGEGRGFMGRSMFDAMYFKIKDLQQKVEQLENIRKDAIEYINKNWGHWCSNHCEYATETINILNKGSEE